jgi:hypothetical protein
MEEFKMGDITLFAKDKQGNLRCLPQDHATVDLNAMADGATMKLINQKNGWKGVCVYQDLTNPGTDFLLLFIGKNPGSDFHILVIGKTSGSGVLKIPAGPILELQSQYSLHILQRVVPNDGSSDGDTFLARSSAVKLCLQIHLIHPPPPLTESTK